MTIAAENIRPNQTILVRGKLTFSRLASLIDGDELQRRIAQQRQRGSLYPVDKPHTTISVVDAKVLAEDPNNPTLEEQYVAERTYTVGKGENTGKRGFNIDDKSRSLPVILEPNPDKEGTYRQVILESDLASNLDVTLVLETFDSGHPKKGLGLAQVVVNEPVKYYASGVDTQALAARGIVIEGGVKRVSGADAAAKAPAGADSGTVIEDGYALPAPGADDAAAYSAPQAAAAPAAAPAAPAPVAAAPAPAAAPAAQGELSTEQLEQLLAQRKAAAEGQGGDSPFAPKAAPAAPAEAAPAAPAAQDDNPWASGNAGIVYGG